MRSTDRKMSLLNFVVTTVKTHFPDLHSFAQGLDLGDATQGVYLLLGACLEERGGGGRRKDPRHQREGRRGKSLQRVGARLPWIPEPSTVNKKLKRREGSGSTGRFFD